MNIIGSFALGISDLSLDFKEIEDNFPIKPSKIIRKGEMIGKLKKILRLLMIYGLMKLL